MAAAFPILTAAVTAVRDSFQTVELICIFLSVLLLFASYLHDEKFCVA